jgi:hypothetical protein
MTQCLPPRNSNRLERDSFAAAGFPAVPRKLSRQAFPLRPQKPPMPCSAASDRKTWVGIRKDTRLRLIFVSQQKEAGSKA